MYRVNFGLCVIFTVAVIALSANSVAGFIRTEAEVESSIRRGFLGRLGPHGGFRGINRNGNRPPKVDLVFVLDSSGSISNDDFYRLKQAMKDVTDIVDQQATVGDGASRIALIKYSEKRKTKIEFGFGARKTPLAVKMAIDGLEHDHGGRTATGFGLEKAREVLQASGADRVKMIWVLTDGQSNVDPSPGIPAGTLKGEGVLIYVVPIGASVNQANSNARREIESIASDPKEDFIFEFQSARSASRSLAKIAGRDKSMFTKFRIGG